jgi:hypothetical protein
MRSAPAPVPAAGSHQRSGTRDDYPEPGRPAEQPRLAVTRAGPQIRVRLPAGGWQVGFRTQPDGRTVIEVTGQDGSLAGLVASAAGPVALTRRLRPITAQLALW